MATMPELLSETTVLPSMGQVIGGQDERSLTSRVRLAVGEAEVEKLEASLRLSVVIPCLNEAATIQECVRRARHALDVHDIEGEVIVADNGSDDGSAVLAAAEGARVVDEPERGYGSAYLAGLAVARGDYILMADADLTYDFDETPHFLAELESGADVVIGNRMKNIRPGAMSWHHRYIGNPLLSGFLNLLFKTGVGDAHCGMRALRRDVLARLDLRTTGMEFASEMVIRAAKEKLDIRQFPIEYHPRGGESKLSSFRDGWRHLRFLLVHSPNYLFIFPGAIMAVLGALVELVVIAHLGIFGRNWDIHALIGGALLAIVGTQVVALGICAHAYGTYFMGERDRWFDRIRARYRLEHGLMVGGGITLTGLAIGTWIVIAWINRGFGPLSDENLAVLAATLIIIGIQVFFSSFLLSILGLRRRDNSVRAPVSRLSDTSRNPPAPAIALVVNRSDRSRE
jgi:glycosyltransferase involved in cell wall biosynthesis